MAMYRSYGADWGDEARLRTPQLAIPAGASATLTFWMYHDTGNPCEPDDDDFVAVQASTDGTTWPDVWDPSDPDNLATFTRYDGRDTDWYQESVDLSGYAGQSIYIGFLSYTGDNWCGDTYNMYIDDVVVQSSITNFSNTNTITIPGSGEASPYPSPITVSGLSGTNYRVTMVLHNSINHTHTSNMHMLLVGPSGAMLVPFSYAGFSKTIVDDTVVLDDEAASYLPYSSWIIPGTYKPTSYDSSAVDFDVNPSPVFPDDYAAGPFYGHGSATFASQFNGTNLNGTWNLYVMEGEWGSGSIDGGWSLVFYESNPTLVELVSFVASVSSGGVVLEWETASELHNAGFHVWRSETEAGPYVRVTDALIPAEGDPVAGSSYSWEDTGVESCRDYWYKLEDIDTAGQSTFHGPVKAVAAEAGGWGVPEAKASTGGPGSQSASTSLGALAMMLMPAGTAAFLLRWFRSRRRGRSG